MGGVGGGGLAFSYNYCNDRWCENNLVSDFIVMFVKLCV